MSIKVKYTLYVFVTTLVIVGVLAGWLLTRQVDELVAVKRETFETLAASLSASVSASLFTLASFPDDRVIIESQLDDVLGSGIQGFKGAVLLDKDGRLVYQRFESEELAERFGPSEPIEELEGENIGERIDATFLSKFPALDGADAPPPTHIESSDIEGIDYEILYRTIPFEADNKTYVSGYLALFFSFADVYASARRAVTLSLTITAVVLAAALVLIWAMTGFITARIYTLVDAVQSLAVGRFVQMEPKGRDELGLLMRETNEMIASVKERLMLSKYVSRSTLEHVANKEDLDVDFAGQYREAALLFTDIRGFTAFTEANEPTRVIAALNAMHDFQVQVVRAFGGDVDKFIADEIMAVFTGPERKERAIRAALAIRRHCEIDPDCMAVGMGINAGRVIWGNIGSHDRLDATYIGDAVNVASRLCDAAGPGEILLTPDLAEAARNVPELAVEPRGPRELQVKGKKEPLTIYSL
jgi:class 3 adenylate cyclase